MTLQPLYGGRRLLFSVLYPVCLIEARRAHWRVTAPARLWLLEQAPAYFFCAVVMQPALTPAPLGHTIGAHLTDTAQPNQWPPLPRFHSPA